MENTLEITKKILLGDMVDLSLWNLQILSHVINFWVDLDLENEWWCVYFMNMRVESWLGKWTIMGDKFVKKK